MHLEAARLEAVTAWIDRYRLAARRTAEGRDLMVESGMEKGMAVYERLDPLVAPAAAYSSTAPPSAI